MSIEQVKSLNQLGKWVRDYRSDIPEGTCDNRIADAFYNEQADHDDAEIKKDYANKAKRLLGRLSKKAKALSGETRKEAWSRFWDVQKFYKDHAVLKDTPILSDKDRERFLTRRGLVEILGHPPPCGPNPAPTLEQHRAPGLGGAQLHDEEPKTVARRLHTDQRRHAANTRAVHVPSDARGAARLTATGSTASAGPSAARGDTSRRSSRRDYESETQPPRAEEVPESRCRSPPTARPRPDIRHSSAP